MVQGVVVPDLLPSKSIWKAAITTQKLGVILAGAADHRQYPDPEEDRRIEVLSDEEFESYRTLARSSGYALENPSIFFIQHVYPSVVGNLPQVVQKARLAEEAIRSFFACSIDRRMASASRNSNHVLPRRIRR